MIQLPSGQLLQIHSSIPIRRRAILRVLTMMIVPHIHCASHRTAQELLQSIRNAEYLGGDGIGEAQIRFRRVERDPERAVVSTMTTDSAVSVWLRGGSSRMQEGEWATVENTGDADGGSGWTVFEIRGSAVE